MAESLFHPSWYRVSRLKPRLRGHTRIYRNEFRGEVWYVLQDPAKGRYYRFTPVAYHVIGRMDGRRTVQELWEDATDRFGDDAPAQGEVVHLLAQLHGADVLLCDVPPDTEELFRRWERFERARRRQGMRSPLAWKIPLLDPERFLERTAAWIRPAFTVWGALLWLAVVGAAGVVAARHWPELTENIVDRVLSARNLVAIYLIYPVVKALHEFGHGYAVKRWGGEVHEMGIMLLVLVPVPYVDASAATEFRSRHRRLVVGAAGILVELFLSALALFLWASLEPGAIRSVAYNVVLIGSVSTILFNANPLLRYDGYYLLADFLEIPNLAQRGLGYLGYLFRRYAFRLPDAEPPHAAPGERFWFVTYTVAAFAYRIFVYAAIVLFIAGKFFFVGVILALWAASSMVLWPLLKGARFLLSSPALGDKRARAVGLAAVSLAALLALLFLVPFPARTRTEGVIWVGEEAIVRAGTDGFVHRVVAPPGGEVRRGDVLVECRHPILAARAAVLRARLEELEARYGAAWTADQVQARIVREEMENTRVALARAEERLADLTIRSPADGRFVLPRAQDLPDRYLHQGDAIAFVLDWERPTIRVVVPQTAVDLIRRRTEKVEVRMAERISRVLPAVVRREVPEAEERLPSTVLGAAGGGEIAVDPFEETRTRTFEKLFQLDLEPAVTVGEVFVGGRVYVRFDHGLEPLAARGYRALRRLFLRRFHV